MPTPAEQRAIQGDKAVLQQAASPPSARGCSCLLIYPCKETITGDEQLTPKAHGGEAFAVRQLIPLDAAYAEQFGGFLDGQRQTSVGFIQNTHLLSVLN